MVLFALVPIGALYAQEDTSISLSDCRAVLGGEVDVSLSAEEWHRCALLEMAAGQPDMAIACFNRINAKKKTTSILLDEVDALLKAYRFDEATKLVEQLRKKRNSRNAADSLQKEISRIKRFVDNCVSLEIIDSLRIERLETLASKRLLSGEWGRISFSDVTGDWIYQTALGYETFYTKLDENGVCRIYYRRSLGNNEIIEEREVEELNSNRGSFYPILRQDGETLYFAAYSDDGMGRLDLYVSRRDPYTRKFLQSTMLGTPFNSPFDDCILIYDDITGKGILGTNRFAPQGEFNLYTFVIKDFFPPVPANTVNEKLIQAKLMPWRLLQPEKDSSNYTSFY